MYLESYYKEKIEMLYLSNPEIHMTVSPEKPHIALHGIRAKIVGVYAHIFMIEEERNGKMERRSLQYGDLAAGIVKIDKIGNGKGN